MNKKLLSVLICVLLVLVAVFAVSCGGDTTTDTDTGASTDNTTSTESDTSTDTSNQEPPTPTECKVTFLLGNGEADIVETVKYGEAIRKMPKTPTKTGYEFKGWLYNNKSWVPSAIKTDMTIIADWQPNNNNLSFEMSGAILDSAMDPMVIPTDTTVALNKCTLVKPGYNFAGWATEDGGEVVYLDGADYKMGTLKYNTLYAVWETATYNITYELNGGVNNEENPSTYTIDNIVTFAEPSKEGYTFSGWTLNGEAVTDTAELYDDITLVANFDLIRYNINYVGIENATNPNPSDFNVEDEIILEAPYREGFEFLGWFSDEALSAPFEKIELGTEQDVTVYASFKILPFKITYEVPEGLTNSEDNIDEFTVETEFTFIAPTVNVKGYEFIGWYIKDTGTKLEALVPGEQNASIVLEARVELINYKITYATDGVEMPEEAPTTYTVNDSSNSYILPTLEKFGYTFGGWFYSHPEDGVWETAVEDNKIVIDPQNPKDITVYAKFTLDTYTITYVLGDEVAGVFVDNPNPTTYDIVNNITFAPATTEDYTFINWYINPEKTSKIKTTEGISGDITLYAKWVFGDNTPTIQLTKDDIADIIINPENAAVNNGWALFDGKTETTGLYNGGSAEWYGKVVGDTLTIIFKEEVEIQLVYAYAHGNWTTSSHTFYDAEGNVVFVLEELVANNSSTSEQLVVFETKEGQPAIDEQPEILEQKPVKVKEIVIKLTSLKWPDAPTWYTHKISEYEIFITNPNYIDPDTL